MIHYIAPRGKGKTTEIVKQCYINDGILIVSNCATEKYIKDCICPRLNISKTKINVITVNDFLSKRGLGKNQKIYIDDLSIVLEKLFGQIEIVTDTPAQ